VLTVYTFIPQGHTASSYYRLLVPFQTAHELGMKVRVHVDTNDTRIDQDMRVRTFCESDVICLYQPIGDSVLQNLRSARSFIPSKRDGNWKYPPSVVIETDDNIFHVGPYNQAYKTLGIRDVDGELIPPGHMMGEVREGERRILWKDGANGFDVMRNRHNLETYKQIIELADCVSCTTKHVEDTVYKYASPSRTAIFPNLVRFDHYEQIELKKDPKRINILWQGGASHYEDWYPLRDSLGRITRKYPEVHWTIWGQLYPWVTELIPADRYTFKNWAPYDEYKLRRMMVGEDISLAPLHDDPFNRCRSAIKWYEASVAKNPAPTLAQATGPYKDEIEDGKTGLLFNSSKEFEEKLSTLIENKRLRNELASNAKDWIKDNRDAFKHAPKYIHFLEHLRDEAPRDLPHMPEEQWPEFEKRFLDSVQAEAEQATKEG
jgi:glycosyltransferase involved in cell wall biosynthesis